tara:strand:+ start:1166 stop:1378 length:213 start_codon:yes stop_codon:yes gene_type:complete
MTGFSFCPPEGLGLLEPLAAVPARSVPLSHSTTLLNTVDHIQQHWRSDLRDSHRPRIMENISLQPADDPI